MAQNDNVVFKTSTTATIDDLFSWDKSTGQITAKTDSIPIVPGTVYFTADGHIVHDLAQNNRLWMSKNAYSAIYAEDVAETNTDIANAIKYSIHYVEGPTTDTTAGTWTGTINGITELYDGLTIIYVPAVAGSSTTTLNINGLGAKTCYYNNTSTITTHYSVGTPILLTYRNNRWRRADYNNNTTYSAMSVAEMRAGTATSLRTIRADYLKTFLSTLGGTNLTLTHSNSAPYLQLNHDPSGITAGTYGNSSQQTPSYGGTFNIPYFTVDTQGHITNASVTTVKLPASDNTDYKVRQTPINSNDNNNYRILLSNSANDTEEDSISKKNANLIYNPTENKLSTGNIKLTGELDVTGNVYLRDQTTVDNLTAGSLIVNGNSTFNNDINLAQGAVKWTSNSLPSVTSADYFLVIDAFANGGATKHITKANAIKSLISSSAIGSSTKPVYWTGSAFSAITSYSGAAALTGTPTAPTAAAGTNTTQIATTEFVTNAVAQGFVVNDAMVFKGLIGSNQPITQLPTSGYNAGWTYRVADAGIFAGEYCEVGDLLIAINDGPASGSSVINTDWGKVEHNIDGAVFRGSGASNSSVGSSTQPVYVNGSGIVTAITGAIANDTTGNAATATTASKLSNTSKIGDTNKPVYFKADGTPAVINYTIDKSVPSNAVFTDTLVKQTKKTDNVNYKILMTTSDSPTSGNASEAAYDTSITINPSTHTLTATNLKGILSTQDLKRPTGLRGLNDVTLQALVNTTRANHLAFLPADQIIIEKTTDGGEHWTDAGVSDVTKLGLFSETRTNVYLPLIEGKRNILCGLRITITAMKYNVPDGTPETEKYNYWNSTYVKSAERYCQLKDMYFWLSSVNDSIGVTVQRATGANSNSWSTIFNDSNFYMTGRSGCNYINFSQNVFGGNSTNQTTQYWNYRIILMTKGVNGTNTMATSSTTTQQSIAEIRGYGDTVWAAANNYMSKDHIYNFDANQNTTFPANVSATKFIGSLQGNADTATTLATGRTLKVNLASTSASTAFNGAANITDIGVSGILPIAQGGTGHTSFTGNRLIFSPTSTTFENAAKIYIKNETNADAYMAINKTSITSGYNFEVNGDSYFAGNIVLQKNPAKQIIREGKSSTWSKGRDVALIKASSCAGYCPTISIKADTSSANNPTEGDGSWDIGVNQQHNKYMHQLIFSYVPGTSYNNNVTAIPSGQIRFHPDGSILGATWTGNTVGVAYGGTGKSTFIPNRLLYTSGSTSLAECTMYASSTQLAINTTSMIDEADTFEVNGMSYLAGEVITDGTISSIENGIYDLGTEDYRWNKIYVNKFDPDVFLQNINVTLSSTWQNIQNNGADIELPYDGTYIIQIYDNTTSVGHYQTYWSGIFSWYTGNISGITNSNGYEYSEIPLHGSGQAINTKNIYLRTYSQNSSKMRLQIKGNNNLTSSTSNVISIKIKYIM